MNEKEYRDKMEYIDKHFDELSLSDVRKRFIEVLPAVETFENSDLLSIHKTMISLLEGRED